MKNTLSPLLKFTVLISFSACFGIDEDKDEIVGPCFPDEQIGEIALRLSSKEFFAYKINDRTQLTFADSSGNKMTFNVESPGINSNSNNRINVEGVCDTRGGISVNFKYYRSEQIDITFHSNSDFFTIQLNTILDGDLGDPSYSFHDVFSFRGEMTDDSIGTIATKSTILFDNVANNMPGENQLYLEELFLINRAFTDVYQFTNATNNDYSYYYTETDGIIGFKKNKNLWVLVN